MKIKIIKNVKEELHLMPIALRFNARLLIDKLAYLVTKS